MIFKTREIRKKITQMRNQGISDESILEELSEEYGRKKVKEIISATAHIQDRSKHRLFVGILLLISMATIIFDVILEKQFSMFHNYSFREVWFSSKTTILLSNITMIVFVLEKRYSQSIYVWIMLACIWTPFAFFVRLMFSETYLYATINLLSVIAICLLSFWFQRKIFPKYNFFKQSINKNILFLSLVIAIFILCLLFVIYIISKYN